MSNDDVWLSRELPDSFFETAGTYSLEEGERLFSEIPEEYKMLAYGILKAGSIIGDDSEFNTCVGFRHFIYKVYKEMLETKGVDLHLPYYWFADGIMIEPEMIVRITNGIIGWRCDEESHKGCGMKGECRYYPEE